MPEAHLVRRLAMEFKLAPSVAKDEWLDHTHLAIAVLRAGRDEDLLRIAHALKSGDEAAAKEYRKLDKDERDAVKAVAFAGVLGRT